MKLLQKNNMLLFSKEYKTADYKYILYFVQVESIWSDRPRIHRLVAVSKKQFMQFQIGFTYALELNKFKISQFTKEGEFELANSDYLRLIEGKLIFGGHNDSIADLLDLTKSLRKLLELLFKADKL